MVAAGKVAADPLVAPNRYDFRPWSEWETISAKALRARAALRKGTALLGTDAPFLNAPLPVNADRRTALLGSHDADPSESKEPPWPGAPQSEHIHQEAGPQAAARAASEPSFFEALPPEPSAPIDAPDFVPAPAPRLLLPKKARSSARLVGVAITLALVLASLGAWTLDRIIHGSPSSNISRYLPAGAPYYLEVPSMRRWTAGLNRVAFLKTPDRSADELLESIFEQLVEAPDPTIRKRLLASIDSFAFTEVNGKALYATQYTSDEAMAEYQKSLPQKAEATEWGKRYENPRGCACLWLERDNVELCGAGDNLDSAIDVLAGRAPSAQQDAYLNAAKKRSFWSYLPFADVPAFYAVGSQPLFTDGSALSDLSHATLTGGLDANGYFEKADLVFRSRKAPRALSPELPLTLWRALPEGTLFYANFHLQVGDKSGDTEKPLPMITLPPGVPSIEHAVEQMKETFGFHPAELTGGLASEALIFVTFPPEDQLSSDAANKFSGALWLQLTIADHAEVRRTLNALVERLSGEQSMLFWKDDNNLAGTLTSDLEAHLSLEKNLLHIGVGHAKELSRVLRSPKSLSDDPAHEAALSEFDNEIAALGWLDWGRLLRAQSFAFGPLLKGSNALTALVHAPTLEGPSRPTGAFFVRRLASGDVRVHSRNFPTGFVLFALGAPGAPPEQVVSQKENSGASGKESGGTLGGGTRRSSASIH